jgi:DNA-binding transcriptional MerR regulator
MTQSKPPRKVWNVEEVARIREAKEKGMSLKNIATMFCLTDAQVRYALYIHGQANKHTELHETELESKREKDFISKYFRKLWFKS